MIKIKEIKHVLDSRLHIEYIKSKILNGTIYEDLNINEDWLIVFISYDNIWNYITCDVVPFEFIVGE